MFLSTLPAVPHRDFDVRGLVIAHVQLTSLVRAPVKDSLIQQLIQQAQQLGGDAVIDIKTEIGGEHGHCVMTGTAVKLR
jgi:uncharacterized protein YbjQ (UPF0145 family)